MVRRERLLVSRIRLSTVILSFFASHGGVFSGSGPLFMPAGLWAWPGRQHALYSVKQHRKLGLDTGRRDDQSIYVQLNHRSKWHTSIFPKDFPALLDR